MVKVMNKNEFKEKYYADKSRYEDNLHNIARLYLRLFLYLFRKSNSIKNKYIKKIYIYIYMFVGRKHGLEIPYNTNIGKGLYIGHPYNITINREAIIGKNCNIHKGVTIGQENRGARKGSPKIGNKVWFGINSTVVGNITIGNDVLIAPNSYVNCDVPSHSVVFGNPCVIKHKENATEYYIERTTK